MITEETKERITRYLINESDFLRVKDTYGEDQLRLHLDELIKNFCQERTIPLTVEDRANLVRTMVAGVVSLGPIRPLMEDSEISEIMVNGAKNIYIQKEGQITKTDVEFDSDQHLLHTIQKILAGSGTNKRVDESSPYVDFSIADGSRVNVILPPCSMNGPVMTIRKFNKGIATVDDVVNLGMIDKRIASLMILAVRAKLNVIFCGSTGAGKTTLLNVFSRHIPEEERIVTIEDTPELRLLQEHVVTLLSKPSNIEGKGEITMRELFVNSLRMRADRVIIGEIRGEELLDLVQSISSGHSGSLAIVHAETPEDCFNRMVTMMLMSGIRLSTEEIRKQVARSIDIIVHTELFMDGRRRVTAVTDVLYDEQSDKIKLHDIFEYKYRETDDEGNYQGEWIMQKEMPSFKHKLDKRRITLPDGMFEE